MPRAVVGCTQLAETVTVAVPSPRSFEDVDTGKAEVVGAREHVAVIGVDLAVAVLARGSEMHGIAGADGGVPRKLTCAGGRTLEQDRRDRKPVPDAARLVLREVIEDLAILRRCVP